MAIKIKQKGFALMRSLLRKNLVGVQRGFTLIEMLVVILIFGILAVVSTQTLALSLRGSRKSEAINTVRANLENSLSVMERQLRNAQSVDPAYCTGSPDIRIDYTAKDGGSARFECLNMGGTDPYIASYSGTTAYRLTSDEIKINTCDITCTQGSGSIPPEIKINLIGEDKKFVGAEGSTVQATTRVLLRTY